MRMTSVQLWATVAGVFVIGFSIPIWSQVASPARGEACAIL